MSDIGDFKIFKGKLIKYLGSDPSVTVPDTVKEIGWEAFSDHKNLEKVVFPTSLLEIDALAFWACKKLKSVVLPSSLSYIGYGAFQDCVSLEEIEIPDSVVMVDRLAFQGCTALKRLKISASLTHIEVSTFKECTALGEVMIPESVRCIKKEAFAGCTALERVVLPPSVSAIEKGAFTGCYSLARFEIDGENRFIAERDGVLYSADGSSLIFYPPAKEDKCFTIPDTVTYIPDQSFRGCRNLRSVVIPESVTGMGSEVFGDCENLETVIIPRSLKKLGNRMFSNCTNLTRLDIPDTVTELGDYVFFGCGNLRRLVIPESVTDVGYCAFAECKALEGLVVPSSVEKIKWGAFAGVGSLHIHRNIGSKWNDILMIRDVCPEYIYTSFKNYNELNDQLKASVLRGFLKEWEDGRRDKAYVEKLVGLIRGKSLRIFKNLDGFLPLYEFVVSQKILSRTSAEKLLERTSSLECRVVILSYLGDLKKRK